MSLVLLDTDVLTLYQFGNVVVCRHVQEHDLADLATTIITVDEQLSGWYTLLRQTKRREDLAGVYERYTNNVRFLSQMQILSCGAAAIDKFEELKALKLGVRAMDLRIAAIALVHPASVATRNLSDFKRVPDLRVEDWSK